MSENLIERQPTYALASTAVGTDFTTIGDELIVNGDADEVWFEITNSGSAALTDFRIQCLNHPDGTWFTYLTGTHFTAAGANDNIASSHGSGSNYANTLGAAEIANFNVFVRGVYAMRVQAKTGTSTTVSGYGCRKRVL